MRLPIAERRGRGSRTLVRLEGMSTWYLLATMGPCAFCGGTAWHVVQDPANHTILENDPPPPPQLRCQKCLPKRYKQRVLFMVEMPTAEELKNLLAGNSASA